MKRLRVGIGRPVGKTSVDRHVLGHFSSDERKVLNSVLVQSVDLLVSLLSEQQPQPKSSSSPAGGRHAAQESQERTRSASPAKDSAAAQSWSFQTLSVKRERWHGRRLWWDFIYSLVRMKVVPHNQKQRFNKVVNYSTDEFHHFWRVNYVFCGWRGTFCAQDAIFPTWQIFKMAVHSIKLPFGDTQELCHVEFHFQYHDCQSVKYTFN